MPDRERGQMLLAAVGTGVRAAATLTLARAVSPAIRVEPGLLRLARRRLVPDADAGIESDVWFSPLVMTRNAGGFVLDPDAAAALRGELAAGVGGASFADEAHAIVEQAHAGYPAALRLEEAVVWEAVLSERDPGRPSVVEDRLREAVKAMVTDPDDGRAAARWVGQAWQRLPPAVTESPAGGLLAAGASLRLGTAIGYASPGAPLPADLGWIAPAVPDEPTTIGVELTGKTLRFVAPESSGAGVLELPPTTPLVAEIAWSDGTARTRRVERLRVGLDVEIGRVVGPITIRTLVGRRYTLEPLLASSGGSDPAWQETASLLERACVWVYSRTSRRHCVGYFVDADLVATSFRAGVDVDVGGTHGRLSASALGEGELSVMVLQIENPPEAHPLPPSLRTWPFEDGTAWLTYGYPDGRGTGRAIRGSVRDGRFVAAEPIPGSLDGAPVLVEGRLIGQVQSVRDDGELELLGADDVRSAVARARERSPAPAVYIATAGRDALRSSSLPERIAAAGLRVLAGSAPDEELQPGQFDEALATSDAAVLLVSRDALASRRFAREADILVWRRQLSPRFVLVVALDESVTSADVRSSQIAQLGEYKHVSARDWRAVVQGLRAALAGPDRRAILGRLRGVLQRARSPALDAGAAALGIPPGIDPPLELAIALALVEPSPEVGRIVEFAGVVAKHLEPPEAQVLTRLIGLLLVSPEGARALRRALDRATPVMVDERFEEIVRLCLDLAWLDEPAPIVVGAPETPIDSPVQFVDHIRDGVARAAGRRPKAMPEDELDVMFAAARTRAPVVAILGEHAVDAAVLYELRGRFPDLALVLLGGTSSLSADVLAEGPFARLGMPLTVASERETLMMLERLGRMVEPRDLPPRA